MYTYIFIHIWHTHTHTHTYNPKSSVFRCMSQVLRNSRAVSPVFSACNSLRSAQVSKETCYRGKEILYTGKRDLLLSLAYLRSRARSWYLSAVIWFKRATPRFKVSSVTLPVIYTKYIYIWYLCAVIWFSSAIPRFRVSRVKLRLQTRTYSTHTHTHTHTQIYRCICMYVCMHIYTHISKVSRITLPRIIWGTARNWRSVTLLQKSGTASISGATLWTYNVGSPRRISVRRREK